MKNLIIVLFIGLILASCSTSQVTKSKRYERMYDEKPLAILVMPPINRSTEVEAKEFFYSSLIVPITLKGYYVLPPLLSMEILKEESAYDAELFINSPMQQVGSLFGVDAVLFTTIHEWSKVALLSQITVTVEYTLKSTKTNEILFNRKGQITYSPNASGNNLLANMVSNILITAFTKEIEIGRKCSVFTLGDMPAGKYDPKWGADGDLKSGEPEFKVKLQ